MKLFSKKMCAELSSDLTKFIHTENVEEDLQQKIELAVEHLNKPTNDSVIETTLSALQYGLLNCSDLDSVKRLRRFFALSSVLIFSILLTVDSIALMMFFRTLV